MEMMEGGKGSTWAPESSRPQARNFEINSDVASTDYLLHELMPQWTMISTGGNPASTLCPGAKHVFISARDRAAGSNGAQPAKDVKDF